jgi:multicomponent Na+:H+ antiporter subunit D
VQDGSVLAWLLVGGSVLTSLLTLYAMAKVWVLAFWRPADQLPAPSPDEEADDQARDDDRRYPVLIGAGPPRDGRTAPAYSGELLGAPSSSRADGQERVALPALMTGATVALVTVGLALTVVAGPLYALADSAAVDLTARTPYISAVFAQSVDHRVAR